ncbi:hypothetical protein ACSVH2_08830 [Flavobacterium sp. RSB2_4_14]|uniref:hypothetical protein n=1 Tax=Flavobacterium sp. RSB2_4_14 TaxID=3447665 RepID=UPI003F3A36C9
MRSSIFKKYFAEGLLTLIPEKPFDGFNHIYTIIPNGKISFEDTVISEIKSNSDKEENCTGFFEIETYKKADLINFHVHNIFNQKNKSKENDMTNLSGFSSSHNSMKCKNHTLFYFVQYNLKSEMNCQEFLEELNRTIDLFSFDMQNKIVYQQVKVSIINNTKEQLIVFHDDYQNLLIYKT